MIAELKNRQRMQKHLHIAHLYDNLIYYSNNSKSWSVTKLKNFGPNKLLC